jgi:hypothetical protein
MSAQQYFVQLDYPFGENGLSNGLITKVTSNAEPVPHHALHLVEYHAYANLEAKLAVVEAELNALKGIAEVPGIPDAPDNGNGTVPPNV